MLLRVRVDLGAMAIKGYSVFSKAPTLLEPHHQIVCVISWTLIGGDLLLRKEAIGVFYSPSRLGHMTLVEGILTLYREAVGVFYSSSRLGDMKLVDGILTLYREAVGVFYSRLGNMKLVEGILTLCREAVVYSTAPADWAIENV